MHKELCLDLVLVKSFSVNPLGFQSFSRGRERASCMLCLTCILAIMLAFLFVYIFFLPNGVIGESVIEIFPGLEVIKFEFILELKVKRNDWLLVDTCPQAANHCTLF